MSAAVFCHKYKMTVIMMADYFACYPILTYIERGLLCQTDFKELLQN